jgi:hypothetical protein
VDGGTPDGSVAAEPKPDAAPETETVTSSYRASEEYEKALDRLLPLRVERVLGVMTTEELAKFGLDQSERRLQVTSRGQVVHFVIGQESYGGATTYLRQEPGGEVYLVSSANLRGVDVVGSRYLERRLAPFKEKDVARLTLATATSSRTFEHLEREKPGPGRWVPAEARDSLDDKYRNWVGKLFRVTASEYLGADPAATQALARIQFERDGEAGEAVEIAFLENLDGKKEYYARSGFTGGWVKLERTSAEGMAADIPSILGLESAPPVAPTPPPKTPPTPPAVPKTP